MGRWVSADPLEVHAPGDADFNLYAYVSGKVLSATDPLGLKEFESYEAYTQSQTDAGLEVKSHAEMWTQGNWLQADREDNTAVWNAANSHNLQTNGSEQYETIEQRADFYDWADKAIGNKGNEVRWTAAAAETAHIVDLAAQKYEAQAQVTSQVGEFEETAHARSMVDFLNKGNKDIFDDVLPKLRALYNGPALKGEQAKQWDSKALAEEQVLVQPLYSQMNDRQLQEAEAGARMESFAAMQRVLYPARDPFPDGSTLRSVNDRWSYGMHLMGHGTKERFPTVDPKYQLILKTGAAK